MKKPSLYYRCQIAGWGSYFIVNFLMAMIFVNLYTATPVYTRMFFTFVITTVTGFFISHIIRSILRRFRFFLLPEKKQVIFFIVIAVLGSYIYAAIVIYIEQVTNLLIWRTLFTKKFFLLLTQYVYAVTAFPFVSWVLIYFLVHFIRQRKLFEQEKVGSEKKIFDLKRKSLQAQMNPRFVFESIGVLNRFIREGHTEPAVGYLTGFSKLIRILLVNADKNEISLYEEIELCRYYLRMEQIKQGQGFQFGILLAGKQDLKSYSITPLFLQSFIGRAIKSGCHSVQIIIEQNDRMQLVISCENITTLPADMADPDLLQAGKDSLTYWKPDERSLSDRWVYSINRPHEYGLDLTLNYKEDE